VVLGITLKALCVLSMHSTTELHTPIPWRILGSYVYYSSSPLPSFYLCSRLVWS
jgi:hypothetical protein